jgi:hypothetical protein
MIHIIDVEILLTIEKSNKKYSKKTQPKDLVNLMLGPNQLIQNGKSLVKLNMVTNWGIFWSIFLVEKIAFSWLKKLHFFVIGVPRFL